MGGQTISAPYVFPTASELAPVAAATVALIGVGVVDTLAAAKMRDITGVRSPRMDGPPFFMRGQRAQMNTIEQAVWFVPSLWMHATLCSPTAAAYVGGSYALTRLLYGVAVRANRYDLVHMLTLPGYFMTGYLALGPIHSHILTRRLGMGERTSAAILAGAYCAVLAAADIYANSLRSVAKEEGAEGKPDPSKDGRIVKAE